MTLDDRMTKLWMLNCDLQNIALSPSKARSYLNNHVLYSVKRNMTFCLKKYNFYQCLSVLWHRMYLTQKYSMWKKLVKMYVQLDWVSIISRQKINLPANHKSYDNSETTDEKLLARRIQIFRVPFSVTIFWPLIFLNKWKYGSNKKEPGRFEFASSNTLVSRSQTLLKCQGSMVNYFLVF